MAFGALGGVSSWVVGPCRGILVAAEYGYLPPLFQKTNKAGMPYVLMIIQALIVTALSLLFILMPNVSSSFWIMTVLAAQLYILMYALLFISGIVLKYKKAKATRAYAVPGGKIGMWIIACLGLVGVLFSFVIGFFPPPGVEISSILFFQGFLSFGIITMVLLPFIIYKFKRPCWITKLEQ
jgi:amino acid transporter